MRETHYDKLVADRQRLIDSVNDIYNRVIPECRRDLVAYKLRIYVQTGPSKGNLQREEFFANKSEMDKRATELFNPNQYGYNATAWELGAEGEYTRLLGY